MSKQPTIFRWQKRHDNILVVKTIVEKPTFFKICFFGKYFHQRLLSLVHMGLHAAIIGLSLLIYEGEQRYKPYIISDPRMVSLLNITSFSLKMSKQMKVFSYFQCKEVQER